MAANQIVIFSLDGEEYGIDVLSVNGILRSNKFKIQIVPGMPYVIEGMINLRGNANCILNLRKIFNLPLKELSEESKFIMLYVKNSIAGCIVDEVTDIIRFNEEELQPIPLFNGMNQGYMKGIVRINERMVVILDPEKLLSI